MSTHTPDRLTPPSDGSPSAGSLSVGRPSVGRTEVEVTAEAGGRCRVRMSTSAPAGVASLRPMLLGSGASHARIALVPEGAMLLGGDRIELSCRVGPGVRLTVVEPAGTVAYDMRGGRASWDVDLDVADGATLVWEGQPFVASAGAEVFRRTTAELAPSATLLLRETLVLGRVGERAGTIWSTTRVTSRDVPLLAEDLELSPASQVPGLLGSHRVLDSILLVGRTGPARTPPPLELSGGGHLYRELAGETHESSLTRIWPALAAYDG